MQYERTKSNNTPEQLQELREKGKVILEKARKQNEANKPEPIEYDAVFFRGMAVLDQIDDD